MSVKTSDLPSIASAAMLGSLNVSLWEGRKKDKETEQEVADSKGAKSRRVASVHKHLFSESPALDSLKNLRGRARVWFNKYTLPWDDNGWRLITTKQYFEIMHDAAVFEKQYSDLVDIFCNNYNTEISKQAFEMGSLFNRDEYPEVEVIKQKFIFCLNVKPLPMAGDFRLDIGNDALEQLKVRYEKDYELRLQCAVSDAWERVKTQVEWVRDRMAAVLEHDPNAVEEEEELDGNGKVVRVKITKKRRPKLHESMLDNGLELCGLLRDLNVTNDPKLEEARKMLENALIHVDMGSLKESTEVQQSTKAKMEEILSKFDF